MLGYQFFAIECLPEVVVEKNKLFHCNSCIHDDADIGSLWSKVVEETGHRQYHHYWLFIQ